MNVIFLDYDGVVNIPLVKKTENGYRICYNWPYDNCVNHKEAIKFIELFCKKYDYQIVCSSSWRHENNYAECLYNGGLSRDIKVIGRTSIAGNKSRAKRIYEWIYKFNPDKYIVIDDYFVPEDEEMKAYFVQTDESVGFMIDAFEKACMIHKGWNFSENKRFEHHHEDN